MKKRNIICLILFFLLLFGALYLYNQKLYTYLIIVVPILFILLFFSIKGIRTKYSPEDEYNIFLKEILKTYDAVLINVVEMPSVDGRSIVKVSNFEDLIDAQIEIRKPIYTITQNNNHLLRFSLT